MSITIRETMYFLCILLLYTSCKPKDVIKNTNELQISLNSTFEDNFHIGAAIGSEVLSGVDSMSKITLLKEFNSITPENLMKWENIHPNLDIYNFESADKYVDFGEENEMFIVGHTLIWHSQLAEYVKSITYPNELKKHIKFHIETIVKRYKGKIDAWDVVNEALNEDGSYRDSHFFKVLGDEYLQLAFQYASEIDSDVDLLYNDYNLYKPEKRAGVVRLVKMLQEKKIKIDGVGMQGHWGLESPSIKDIEASIIAYSDLGVKVSITELDITVLPNPWDLEGADVNQNFEGSPYMNPYPNAMPDSISTKLAERYASIFSLFLKHSDKLDRVTFWGVNDGQSWLNNWPIKNRTNYPLLFDRKFHKKKAYDEVLQLKS